MSAPVSAEPTPMTPTAVPKLSPNARLTFTIAAPATAADPFGTFLRQHVHGRGVNHRDDDGTTSVSGTILAESTIDDVRYVVVRCASKPNEALLTLSPRERDIVNLITKGYPNKTIAELLDISAWTVGTHLRRIFAKLGVTSRAAMVARYLHHVGEPNGGMKKGPRDEELRAGFKR